MAHLSPSAVLTATLVVVVAALAGTTTADNCPTVACPRTFLSRLQDNVDNNGNWNISEYLCGGFTVGTAVRTLNVDPELFPLWPESNQIVMADGAWLEARGSEFAGWCTDMRHRGYLPLVYNAERGYGAMADVVEGGCQWVTAIDTSPYGQPGFDNQYNEMPSFMRNALLRDLDLHEVDTWINNRVWDDGKVSKYIESRFDEATRNCLALSPRTDSTPFLDVLTFDPAGTHKYAWAQLETFMTGWVVDFFDVYNGGLWNVKATAEMLGLVTEEFYYRNLSLSTTHDYNMQRTVVIRDGYAWNDDYHMYDAAAMMLCVGYHHIIFSPEVGNEPIDRASIAYHREQVDALWPLYCPTGKWGHDFPGTPQWVPPERR